MSILAFLTYVVSAILVYLGVSYKIKRWKLETLGEKIPGPRAYPLVGNSLLFASVNSAKDLFYVGMQVTADAVAQHGKLFRIWMGPLLAVAVTDVDDINSFLSSPLCSTKHWWYTRIASFMSTHTVFGTNGKEWQELRKPLMRHFHIKEIESYMGIFETKAMQMVSKIEKRLGTGVFNIHDYVKFYVLDIAAITHLGAEDMNEIEENRHDFHHHLERSLEIAFTRALSPKYLLDCIYGFTHLGRENKKADWALTGISRRIISQRMEVLKQRGVDLNSDFAEEYYTDAIIKRGIHEGWSLQDMALAITDIVVGGSDTTALGLAYTILCLAMHPECQERAYQEQLDIFGESDRPPTFKEAMGMPYLTMCWKEALRLHGPVGIARELTGDFKLRDLVIPEGAGIFLMLRPAQRDPKLYDRPEEFYPEHFMPEAVAKRPKNSFLTLSFGSRGCPGLLYSQTSAKMLLSLLIRKFKFSSPMKYNELTFRYSLMVENCDGYPVEVYKRTQRESA